MNKYAIALIVVLGVTVGTYARPGRQRNKTPKHDVIDEETLLRCQSLYASFIPLRDAALNFVEANPDMEPYLQLIQMTLNFPVTSDSSWRSLWCRVAAAKDFMGLAISLKIRVRPEQLRQLTQHFKQIIYELEDVLPEYILHNTELATWMNKTGFPDRWPVTNTNEQEVITLIELHDLAERKNPLLLGADSTGLTNEEIATTLLESTSLEEYLVNLGSAWLASGKEPLTTNIDWLHSMQDPAKMDVYYNALWRLFEFTRKLEQLGILDMI